MGRERKRYDNFIQDTDNTFTGYMIQDTGYIIHDTENSIETVVKLRGRSVGTGGEREGKEKGKEWWKMGDKECGKERERERGNERGSERGKIGGKCVGKRWEGRGEIM